MQSANTLAASLKIFDAKHVGGIPDGQRHCLVTDEDRAVMHLVCARMSYPGHNIQDIWDIGMGMKLGDRVDAQLMAQLVAGPGHVMSLLRKIFRPEILRPVLAGEGLATPATLELMLLTEPSEYVAAAVLAVSTRGE